MLKRWAVLGALVLASAAALAASQEAEPPTEVASVSRQNPTPTHIAQVYYKDLYFGAEVPMSTGEEYVPLQENEILPYVTGRLAPGKELAGQILIRVCPIVSQDPFLKSIVLAEEKNCTLYPEEENLKRGQSQ